MLCVAVFIDAGYLFAEGSKALGRTSAPRSQTNLNCKEVVQSLEDFAGRKAPGARLLRIYWYDGSAMGRLTIAQTQIANTDNVKLRLGQINSVGEQKGVDSLIVTDLIDLARNRAITDAVLLSGDEDVRIAVQIAQSFGVRVHLLGIGGPKSSQSPHMLQEADTTDLFSPDDVRQFLSFTDEPLPSIEPQVFDIQGLQDQLKTVPSGKHVKELAREFAMSLSIDRVRDFAAFRKQYSSIPPEFDRPMLATVRNAMGRDLSAAEKNEMRAAFVDCIKGQHPELFS